MEQQKFDNMIQVLTYFADQCDMFKPMLDGVHTLKNENIGLKNELKDQVIIHNRMQLNSTFAADYANFGVATVKTAASANTTDTEAEPDKDLLAKKTPSDDLYNLLKAVINVGRHNYNKTDMEYKLDFYSMTGRISFEQYLELFELIDSQEQEVPMEQITQPESESKQELIITNPEIGKDQVVTKDITVKNVSK